MITFKEHIEDITDEELDQLAEEMSFEELYDFYTNQELVIVEFTYDELNEGISQASRMKRAQRMRANKARLLMARRSKLMRMASNEKIKDRAKLAARRALIKKFLKGRSKEELSAQEKDRLEKMIKNMPVVVSNMQSKLLPKMRQIERGRMAYKKK